MLVFPKFSHSSPEPKETWRLGTTESQVWIGNFNVKAWKTTKHKLHKIWRSLKFCKNTGRQAHPWSYFAPFPWSHKITNIYFISWHENLEQFKKNWRIFFFNFWMTSVLFVGPLIPLVWTSSDVCSGGVKNRLFTCVDVWSRSQRERAFDTYGRRWTNQSNFASGFSYLFPQMI